jgi:hypothetical protein
MGLIVAVSAMHAYACTRSAFTTYTLLLCGPFHIRACKLAENLVQASDPELAQRLHTRIRRWSPSEDRWSPVLESADSAP